MRTSFCRSAENANPHSDVDFSLALLEISDQDDVLVLHVHDEGVHAAVILEHVLGELVDELLLLIRRLGIKELQYGNFPGRGDAHLDLLGGQSQRLEMTCDK